MVTIRDLINEHKDSLKLSWIANEEHGDRAITDEALSSADLVGHLNMVHPDRIQVFGIEEVTFYNRLPKPTQNRLLKELKTHDVPCIIIAEGLEVPTSLHRFCSKQGVPLLSSPAEAAYLIEVIRIYLSRYFAPKTTVHGVFMDVLGLGVLITGESGLGKSELALELISRGHGLVADDIVEFTRPSPHVIEGRCNPLLQNLLEVRGIGLLDIKTIFGETSVRRKMNLKLIVHLVKSHGEDFERLPFQDQSEDVLGVPTLRVKLAVLAGRNLAVLVEAAVRNTILKLRGIDTLAEFMKRQSLAIQESSNNE
ncbi:HPr kinase/phosphorylase [Oligella urethralis]|uniref:HPr(Ser) kinase/phosphatase n=1 Tax=Oligella urethralis TaxID=90245 RepID=UPI0025512EC2|nr:HPr(Ser) kinase/phosphatase [Oligella urethralis]MDK6202495.1 HPr(Ser) kinase/phosphatase [Oligella urethralis]WOS38418.1 HPr kinase/phosphorylase [Oligella urethralis]